MEKPGSLGLSEIDQTICEVTINTDIQLQNRIVKIILNNRSPYE